MVFPVKKRITTKHHGHVPSGLDLLSVAIDTCQQLGNSDSTVISSYSSAEGEYSNGAVSEDSDTIHDSKTQKSVRAAATAGATYKRANAFPQILMNILSNPDYSHIISWLPNHNKRFAVHDHSLFSSQILPKYFRRVIFRSFVRKLNRWGFRSVKRSVSGFDSTFEHPYFCRDLPEFCAQMSCQSTPLSTAAPKSSSRRPSPVPSASQSVTPTSPEVPTTVVSRASQEPLPDFNAFNSAIDLRNERLLAQLHERELVMQELQQRRQQMMLQLIPMLEPDNSLVSLYFAEKLRTLQSQAQQVRNYV